ncbi:MAG: hypothetical protein Q4E36_04505 [Bacillota bacterium]|nr:hypothetical protein [Bacillota bacterium]
MNKLKEFLEKLSKGRYGMDHLNVFLIYVVFVLSFVGLFINSARTFNVLRALAGILSIFAIYRIMSKNVNARYQENIKYLKATKPLRAEMELLALKWKDRKTHRYVKCPSCKKIMRVPKKAGKIKIRCPRCGHEFIKRV